MSDQQDLERLARAACTAAWASECDGWDDASEEQRNEFRVIATGVLRELRNPSEGMVEQLARRLWDKQNQLIPTEAATWESLSELDREFYRHSVIYVMQGFPAALGEERE